MKEFDIIERYMAPLSRGTKGTYDLHNDAACFEVEKGYEAVITTDAIVEGVHFLPQDGADAIAKKLLRVNLSDLAAMGAAPLYYLLVAGLSSSQGDTWISKFAEGLAQDQKFYNVGLLGGDTTQTSGPGFFTLTAIGQVKVGQAHTRQGAKPGDMIYVCGQIGEGALGLLVREGMLADIPEKYRAVLSDRYLLPQPRIELGQRLLGLATSVIDISDGLVGDLHHITDASNCGAVINIGDIPLSEAVLFALRHDPNLWEKVLTGGDDYELLFTLAPDQGEKLTKISKDLNLALSCIGHMTDETEAGVKVLDQSGREVSFAQEGWQHEIGD